MQRFETASVGGLLIPAQHTRLCAPASPRKLVVHASVGLARQLGRALELGQTRAGVAAQLANVADSAFSMFRWDLVGTIGDLLVELANTPESAVVGRYYQALRINRTGSQGKAAAAPLFELVAEQAPPRYRARALIAIGNNFFAKSDHLEALSTYRGAVEILSRATIFDPVTLFDARKNIAVVRALEGDHRGSLDDLENLLPIARVASSVRPHLYYDYLNGLAVELGEAGRLEEARRASSVAVASPYASLVPAYRETLEDIVEKQRKASRSVVGPALRRAISPPSRRLRAEKPGRTDSSKPANILLLRASTSERQTKTKLRFHGKESARVINFQQWKAQTRGAAHLLKGSLSPEASGEMTTGEKLIRLMDLISRDETDDQMIDRILTAVEAIVVGRAADSLD